MSSKRQIGPQASSATGGGKPPRRRRSASALRGRGLFLLVQVPRVREMRECTLGSAQGFQPHKLASERIHWPVPVLHLQPLRFGTPPTRLSNDQAQQRRGRPLRRVFQGCASGGRLGDWSVSGGPRPCRIAAEGLRGDILLRWASGPGGTMLWPHRAYRFLRHPAEPAPRDPRLFA
jgi:hypothetical protein